MPRKTDTNCLTEVYCQIVTYCTKKKNENFSNARSEIRTKVFVFAMGVPRNMEGVVLKIFYCISN